MTPTDFRRSSYLQTSDSLPVLFLAGVTMPTWIAVAAGGAIGSMARHWVNLEMAHRLERSTPHATFVVNVIGCFVIGVLAGLVASGRLHMSPMARTFVFVGILGGFTTFSSFGLDTFTLAHGGDHVTAFWNVAGQITLGLGCVWLGFSLGHL